MAGVDLHADDRCAWCGARAVVLVYTDPGHANTVGDIVSVHQAPACSGCIEGSPDLQRAFGEPVKYWHEQASKARRSAAAHRRLAVGAQLALFTVRDQPPMEASYG